MRIAERWADWWKVRPYFDAEFYLARYADVREAGMDPLRHYLLHGAAEGRKPLALFEPAYYGNTLLHFIETRGRPGNPHPLFDCAAYLAAHPEVGERANPLLHYIQHGPRVTGVVNIGALNICDVDVAVTFSEDAEGRLRFECEPQQRPFFAAMRFDQLLINSR